MANYFIGDIQGCHAAFIRLLERIDFSASRDTLYLLGDLVNRGPDSAGVLRRAMELGDSVRALLGNHDLHLLAAAHGARHPSRRDTLASVLDAKDRDAMLEWVRHQPLARSFSLNGERMLMVHAGVLPQWSFDDTLAYADEVRQLLQGPDLYAFLMEMYGNLPDRWSDDLRGADRLRVIINALTRLRFCSCDGVMDFDSTESAATPPDGLMPWFDVPGRRTADTLVAFGHWSTLGLVNRPHLLALDTGCIWGGCLSAMRIGTSLADRELFDVECEQAQKPGN
ncbi:symmetrical bis(5'-nucleosyl)-tetraphosphatase [Diaphorobacter caeni]|uniref:symmetrical bis(5'-nucleosyl)-tetraphosphatase n=1 Tax=Diaphorobacter caeni TaxID=2784387 RepID=UPI00188E618D|nr:symmetrical bis(5'-nucleosyl)-tetraphosphatase [Diaphorobacter caeni]MBF5007052.1 symmetrical bis(5'-nucleosyl)-tetraphosphatase [Diaphorobacter caeni]